MCTCISTCSQEEVRILCLHNNVIAPKSVTLHFGKNEQVNVTKQVCIHTHYSASCLMLSDSGQCISQHTPCVLIIISKL